MKPTTLIWVVAAGFACAGTVWAGETDRFEAGTAQQLMRRYASRTQAVADHSQRVIVAQPLVGNAQGDRGTRGIRGVENERREQRYVPPAVVAVAPARNSIAAESARVVTGPAAASRAVRPAVYTRETVEPIGPAVVDDDVDVIQETDQVEVASSVQLVGHGGRNYSWNRSGGHGRNYSHGHRSYYGHRGYYGHRRYYGHGGHYGHYRYYAPRYYGGYYYRPYCGPAYYGYRPYWGSYWYPGDYAYFGYRGGHCGDGFSFGFGFRF